MGSNPVQEILQIFVFRDVLVAYIITNAISNVFLTSKTAASKTGGLLGQSAKHAENRSTTLHHRSALSIMIPAF